MTVPTANSLKVISPAPARKSLSLTRTTAAEAELASDAATTRAATAARFCITHLHAGCTSIRGGWQTQASTSITEYSRFCYHILPAAGT
ncbi:MAG: hypothetical protein CVT80_16145 [Alphaproteobacteria bacterium HGW-Alphaproteobacteria-2]|nr:MAG: hypothetical protein CVT80_16145 [Alphaproteobacteria bacterium HGW-Alphaproteobacteria-2]